MEKTCHDFDVDYEPLEMLDAYKQMVLLSTNAIWSITELAALIGLFLFQLRSEQKNK